MLGKKTTVFVKGLFPNLDSATVSKIAEERRICSIMRLRMIRL
jgi:hypothetical protein